MAFLFAKQKSQEIPPNNPSVLRAKPSFLDIFLRFKQKIPRRSRTAIYDIYFAYYISRYSIRNKTPGDRKMIGLPSLLSSLLLTSAVAIPNSMANGSVGNLRVAIRRLSFLQLLIALGSLIYFATQPAQANATLSGLVMYDQLSAIMITLVSFVGWVVCSYSVQYLDGEAEQGSYFRWTSFTIGSVSLFILSGNLLGMLIAWMMTSLGIHRLLLHYPDRPAAQRAAWIKFTISRIGDVAIASALAIYFFQYGTVDLRSLFDIAANDTVHQQTSFQMAGWLLALGAVTKSAQIPFHTWMPLTIETPTPVSALMHAGIVNAGGFLMLRVSPLLSQVQGASLILISFGGLTAILAALVMLTQTSIKKKLAYSTISQMGFMLLQCGLGAYSAALLHILAHSLYKAHAFLSSGSVLNQPAAGSSKIFTTKPFVGISQYAVAVCGLAACLLSVFWLANISLIKNPGSVLLVVVFCFGVGQWLAQLLSSESYGLKLFGWGCSIILCVIYAVSYKTLGNWLQPVVGVQLPFPSMVAVSSSLVALFFLAAYFQLRSAKFRESNWFQNLYVHATNGFYLEGLLWRWAGSFGRS